MSYRILGSAWHTPPYNGVLSYEFNLSPCIGVVAIESGPAQKDGTVNWKAYIGYGAGKDEKIDQQRIAANGSRLSKDVACAYFPHLPIEGWQS